MPILQPTATIATAITWLAGQLFHPIIYLYDLMILQISLLVQHYVIYRICCLRCVITSKSYPQKQKKMAEGITWEL